MSSGAARVNRDTERSDHTSFLHAVMLSVGGSMLTLATAVVNSVIVSRALGPEGRGTYALATAAVATLWLMIGGGLQYANTFWASRERERIPALFWHSVLYALGVALLLGIAYTVWPTWLQVMLGKEAPRTITHIVLAATVLVLLMEYELALLGGQQRFLAYNAVRAANGLALVVVNLAATVLLRVGVVGIVLAWGIVNLGAVLLAAVLIRIRTPLPLRLDWRTFTASLTVGGRGAVVAIAGMLLSRLDFFLVGHWAGNTAAGYYATAVLLTELPLRLPDVLGTVLFPTVAHADTAAGDALTVRVIRSTLTLALIGTAGLAVVGYPFIVLAFGRDFAPAYPVLLWLLPGGVALALSVVVNQHLAGRGFPTVMLVATIVALVLTLAIDVVTIPRWQASGAAIGASVGYSVRTAVLLCYFVRRSGARWRALLVPSGRDLADLWAIITHHRRRFAAALH